MCKYMLLTLRNVEKKIDGKVILPNINLDIYGGKIIGLLGPNGSGKTTLLKLIAGLNYPTAGMLTFFGQKYRYPETSWYINYLPDTLVFPQNYRVMEAADFYQMNYPDFDFSKLTTILNDLQIDLMTPFRNMSKGQQERVMLALVLSRRTKLTLLDEPLAAIDVITRDEILYLLRKYIDRDSTMIISTHLIFDMQDFFDEVIFLQQGNILLYKTAEQIVAESQMDLLTYYRNFFTLNNGQGGYF